VEKEGGKQVVGLWRQISVQGDITMGGRREEVWWPGLATLGEKNEGGKKKREA